MAVEYKHFVTRMALLIKCPYCNSEPHFACKNGKKVLNHLHFARVSTAISEAEKAYMSEFVDAAIGRINGE